MEKIVTIVVLAGKLSLCWPLVTTQSWQNLHPTCLRCVNPSFVLQCLLCLYLMVSALDTWANGSLNRNHDRLSDRIYYFMEYSAAVVADVVIRVSTLAHWNQICALIKDLRRLIQRPSFSSFWSSKITAVYIIFAFAAAIADLFSSCFIVYKENVLANDSFLENSDLWLLPRNEMIIRTVFVITDTLAYTSLVVAILFLNCLGPILLDIYNLHMSQFTEEFLGGPLGIVEYAAAEFGSNEELESPSQSKKKRFREFAGDFHALDHCLQTFVSLGGYYALALLFRSGVAIILVVATAAGIAENSEFIQSGDYLLYVGQVAALLLLANFGTMMQTGVCNVRRQLKARKCTVVDSEADGKLKSILESILGSNNWNLTACQFFPVGRGLLAGVAEMSLAVLIFMFQLRASETQEKATKSSG